jgi:hypothetical protein
MRNYLSWISGGMIEEWHHRIAALALAVIHFSLPV